MKACLGRQSGGWRWAVNRGAIDGRPPAIAGQSPPVINRRGMQLTAVAITSGRLGCNGNASCAPQAHRRHHRVRGISFRVLGTALFSSVLGGGSRSNGHNCEAQYSKRTKGCDNRFPSKKDGSQSVQCPCSKIMTQIAAAALHVPQAPQVQRSQWPCLHRCFAPGALFQAHHARRK